jgi:hypothetical protein
MSRGGDAPGDEEERWHGAWRGSGREGEDADGTTW